MFPPLLLSAIYSCLLISSGVSNLVFCYFRVWHLWLHLIVSLYLHVLFLHLCFVWFFLFCIMLLHVLCICLFQFSHTRKRMHARILHPDMVPKFPFPTLAAISIPFL